MPGKLHYDQRKIAAFNDPLDSTLSNRSSFTSFSLLCDKRIDLLPFMDRVCPLLEQRGVKMTVSKCETTIYSPYWSDLLEPKTTNT